MRKVLADWTGLGWTGLDWAGMFSGPYLSAMRGSPCAGRAGRAGRAGCLPAHAGRLIVLVMFSKLIT